MLKDKLIDKQTDITDRKNLPMIIDQRIVQACFATRSLAGGLTSKLIFS